MAEIRLTAVKTTETARCACIPLEHEASLGIRLDKDGHAVAELNLYIGDSRIIVSPADADNVERLGAKLMVIARKLRAREGA